MISNVLILGKWITILKRYTLQNLCFLINLCQRYCHIIILSIVITYVLNNTHSFFWIIYVNLHWKWNKSAITCFKCKFTIDFIEFRKWMRRIIVREQLFYFTKLLLIYNDLANNKKDKCKWGYTYFCVEELFVSQMI